VGAVFALGSCRLEMPKRPMLLLVSFLAAYGFRESDSPLSRLGDSVVQLIPLTSTFVNKLSTRRNPMLRNRTCFLVWP